MRNVYTITMKEKNADNRNDKIKFHLLVTQKSHCHVACQCEIVMIQS